MSRAVQLPSPAAILIVDDDLALCQALAALLETEGHSVQIATNGPAAIAAIEKIPFRLVILDVHLQEIDGLHLARYLRNHWPETKIAIHSGVDERDVRARYDDYDAHLLKGATPEAALDGVRRLMA